MEYNHIAKILETYRKLQTLYGESKPNKKLLETVFELYAYAYEAGEMEEHQRVHFFFPEMYKMDELLEYCHKKK